MTTKDSTEYGWIVISQAEYDRRERHGHAGRESGGTVWVMAQDETGATCLYKGVEITA